MSQEVSTNPSVLDEIDEPASTRAADPIDLLGDGSFPMESYANSLMNELFGEVDRLFEGGSIPVEMPAPQEVSLQPIAIPRLEVPDLSFAQLAPLESDTQIATPDAEAIATLEPAANRLGMSRWLLAAAFASAIAAGVSWLVFFRPAPTADPAQTAQPSQADQQFMSYVQQSLDRIAGRTQTDSPAVATAPSPAALPSVAVPSSASNAPSAPDRVYVPVYQPPQTLYPPAGVSAVPVVPPVAVAPVPVPARPATIPAAPRPATVPVPAPAASVAAAPAPAPAPAPQQTLMGLMQFGDRSAALFEVGGSPQRISVGENIGTSGWTLVSVSNDTAVIRRNGEVRSIYVGQQF